MRFGELMTAMVTPFNAEQQVDYKALEKLAYHLVATGTDTLVAVGTTGESPTLTRAEKLEIFKFLRQKLSRDTPIVAGTGSYSTDETVKFSLAAQEVGVDALLVVNPYYNKPCQEGLFRHFSAVAKAVEVPIILYNHPGRTGVSLSLETVLRLRHQHSNIVAIKDSSGDLGFLSLLRAQIDDGFDIYSGDDPLTLPILSIGGAGVVSVCSHIAGNEVKQLVKSFKEGDHAKALEIHQKLVPLSQAMFCAPSPAPVKYALELLGLSVGAVRLPLVDLNTDDIAKVHQTLIALGYLGDKR